MQIGLQLKRCPEKDDVNSSTEMHLHGLNLSFKTPLGFRKHIMNNWNIGYNSLDFVMRQYNVS